MALTTTPLGRKLQYDITQQTETESVPDINVRVDPTTLYALDIDNTSTSGTLSYVKLFDDKGDGLAVAVAAGNARAKIVIPVAALGTLGGAPLVGRAVMNTPAGLSFVNGLSWLASQDGGNDPGSTPAGNVRLQATTQEAA